MGEGGRFTLTNMLVIIVGGIPIAMPTVLSVTLALGAYKLAKEGAIVARMNAVEEMAGMDILCSDKTDFPKKGIMFHDVTSLLLDPKAFQLSIDDFAARYKDHKIDVVAGFEARGFIFGAPLALQLKCAFVPLRKPGKLPGETIGASYQLEYGEDRIEMHLGHVKEGQRVLLIDDLIATGGTLAAGIKLMNQVKAEIVECACVIELPDLNGKAKLGGLPLYVQVQKEGD